MMFSEFPTLAERYGAAKAAGFKYVESAFPYFEPLESLRDAKEKAGVEQIVINTWPGKKKTPTTIVKDQVNKNSCCSLAWYHRVEQLVGDPLSLTEILRTWLILMYFIKIPI